MNHWRRAEDRRRLAIVEQVVRPARDADWLAAADGHAVRLGSHVEVRLDEDGRPSAVVVALAAEPEPRPQPDAPRPRRRRDG